MKKYLVLRTNHGLKGRLWTEGQVAEFEDNVVPNHHFQLITSKTVMPVPEKNEVTPAALSQLQQNSKKEPTAAVALKNETGIAQKPLTPQEREQLNNLNEGEGAI